MAALLVAVAFAAYANAWPNTLVLDDTSFEQRTVRLDVGDLLVLYTDGITDATRDDGKRFEMERLRRVVSQARHESAQGMLEAIELAVAGFTRVNEQFDDMAIVVARRVASGEQ